MASPSFGILDFNDVVHTYPAALQKIQASIRTAIQEYEPRLRNVVVVCLSDAEEPAALKFEITAQLAQKGSRGFLRFRTRMGAGGQIDLMVTREAGACSASIT